MAKKWYPTKYYERVGWNVVRPILRDMGFKVKLSTEYTGPKGYKRRRVYTDRKITRKESNAVYKNILRIMM